MIVKSRGHLNQKWYFPDMDLLVRAYWWCSACGYTWVDGEEVAHCPRCKSIRIVRQKASV